MRWWTVVALILLRPALLRRAPLAADLIRTPLVASDRVFGACLIRGQGCDRGEECHKHQGVAGCPSRREAFYERIEPGSIHSQSSGDGPHSGLTWREMT
jgi:hypothetical protein